MGFRKRPINRRRQPKHHEQNKSRVSRASEIKNSSHRESKQQDKRSLNLERATLPQTLHLGLLRPRRFFGGVPVRLAKWLEGTVTLAVTVLGVVVVVVAVSELLLLTDGDGAAMQENKTKEEETRRKIGIRRGKFEGKRRERGWELGNWWRIFENLLKGGRFGYLCFSLAVTDQEIGDGENCKEIRRASSFPSLNGFGVKFFNFGISEIGLVNHKYGEFGPTL